MQIVKYVKTKAKKVCIMERQLGIYMLEVKNIINARDQRKQNESNLVTYEDFEALTTRLESLISRIELLEITIEKSKPVKKQKSTVSKKISKRKN